MIVVLGFAAHAGTPNAFKATVSSNSTPSIDPPATAGSDQDNDEGLVDLTHTKDLPPHVPSEEENHLATELFRSPLIPAVDLISPLPQMEWDLFKKIISLNIDVFHVTPSQLEFSNKTLLQIAESKQWTSTYQMDMLVHMLSARHSEVLQKEKATFIPPILSSVIAEDYIKFSKSKKKNSFTWDKRLVDIVLHPGNKWLEDIHTIYMPMLWNESHWVGLSINLYMGYVEILDPLPALNGVRRVGKFMKPLVASLPYLVRQIAMCELTQFKGVKQFVWKRIPNHYTNTRSGDCGPVSMKFLKMHAHGDPAPGMASITDHIVDDIRKQYAMDLYKTIVLPSYYALHISDA